MKSWHKNSNQKKKKPNFLEKTGWCFQCRCKVSARESVITQWRKKVRWKWASYHLHTTKYFTCFHLLCSLPSPPVENRGIPTVLELCLGLFKRRSIATSFTPISISFYYSCWLLIFIASYFVKRESILMLCRLFAFFYLVIKQEVKETKSNLFLQYFQFTS